MTNKIFLVTGASGFIGRQLVGALLQTTDANVRVLMRSTSAQPHPDWPPARVQSVMGDLTQPASLARVCEGADTVFHLAGYAHADDSDQASGYQRHRRITVEGTRALLDRAIAARVKKFVFVSSVKAMGEGIDAELNEDDESPPSSGYGKAKREAEELVLSAGREHGFHAVVLRLPLVYGRHNKGNIVRMIAAVDRGRFPPLPAVHNRRSMVHVDDVVGAAMLVAADPRANGECYIVTDGRHYSTRELYELICRALGKPIPRWSVPFVLLRAAARIGDLLARILRRPFPVDSLMLGKLLGSACYSSEKIKRELSFYPRRTFSDGLAEMVDQYRRQHSL